MKVLVTGGTGFIGSHVVTELLNSGIEVIIADNLCNSFEDVLGRIEKICHKKPVFYQLDLSDFSACQNLFNKEDRIDAIIHFAALKSNAESIQQPGLYFTNNLLSTFNLLRIMEMKGIKNIIYSSSATVYGTPKEVPDHENDVVGKVISPYGLTKYIGELLIKDFVTQRKGYKAIALRYFNPVGAHRSGLIGECAPLNIPNNLILYMIKVAQGKLPFLRIFGNDYPTIDGTGLRDYIHVVDLAKGHLAALSYFPKMLSPFDVFNLGTGHGTTVLEFVNAFEKYNNVKIPYEFAPRRPGDVAKSFADVSKANSLLDWKAELSVQDCVEDAWRFAVNNPDGYRQ